VPLGIAIINSENHAARSVLAQVKEFVTNPIIAASAVGMVLAALPTAQNLNTYAAVFQRGETLARDTTLITTVASVPVIALIALFMGL
jgi:predicted permease